MARWLLTGATGFLGGHVSRAIASGGALDADVVVVGRRPPAGWDPRAFISADLEEPSSVARAVRSVRPSIVIHVAGKTPPGHASEFDRANVQATIHLLDALRSQRSPVRVVLVGSAAELGRVDEDELPICEDQGRRPTDAYGWSKLLSTTAGLLAAQGSLEVVIARIFNPIGPGAPAHSAFGGFVRRLLDPTPGPLLVGDLDARRDFIDVRDVARALLALTTQGRSGQVYHVGTGVSRRVGDGLARLLKRSGRQIEIQVDPGRLGDARGPRDSRADVRKITTETDWRPAISWERSLDDLWDAAASSARRALPLTA